MKRVCAWCGKEFDSPGTSNTTGVSQADSICLACANSLISKIPHDMGEFLDDIAVPILLLDGEATVRQANRSARALLGKNEEHIIGLAGGDVFECAYARLPEGCGRTVHCSGCAIRRTVMATFTTGVGMSRVPASLMHRAADRQDLEEIHFVISTEKFRERVMLRIDYVHP